MKKIDTGSRWGAIVACLAVTSCSPSADEVSGLSDEDVRAIRESQQFFVEAELAGAWEEAVEIFAEEAVRMEPNTPWIEGRAAILAGLQENDFSVESFSVTSSELLGENSLAVDRGTYVFVATDPNSGARISDEGKYLQVWTKQADGSWLVATEIWNSDLPVEGQ